MLKRLLQLKNKKGFTLIEMIVVLVIIAILVVATVPTMIGFINDARDKASAAEARTVYVAAQKEATEIAAKGFTGTLAAAVSTSMNSGSGNALIADMNISNIVVTITNAATAKVDEVTYTNSASKTVTFSASASSITVS